MDDESGIPLISLPARHGHGGRRRANGHNSHDYEYDDSPISDPDEIGPPRSSEDSVILENINYMAALMKNNNKTSYDVESQAVDSHHNHDDNDDDDHHHRAQTYTYLGSNRRSRITNISGLVISCIIVVYLMVTYSKGPELAYPSQVRATPGRSLLEMNDILEGKFYPQFTYFEWLETTSVNNIEIPGPAYLTRHPTQGYYEIKSITDDSFTHNLTQSYWFTYNNTRYAIHSFTPRPGPMLTHAVITTNSTTLWRHSSLSQYWLLDITTGLIEPLTEPEDKAYLADWSHTGQHLALVIDDDIYLYSLENKSTTRITHHDDNDDVLYGRPSWVYEEEIFQTNKAMWWSPDDTHLAILKTNQSEVKTYPLTYYVPSGALESGNDHYHDPVYPSIVQLKYPKPGYPNPVVDVLVYSINDQELFSLTSSDASHRNDLITEILWTGNDHLLIKYTDRYSDLMSVDLSDISSRSSQNVRSLNVKDLDGGYVEVTRDTLYVRPTESNPEEGYIDTIIVDGYNHLAYFSPLDASEPTRILTRGPWEVVTKVAVDGLARKVYFVSTEKSSLERHLYSVSLDVDESTTPDLISPTNNFTDTSLDGYYEQIQIDPTSAYVIMTYVGPEIPYQIVKQLKSGDTVKTLPIINRTPIPLNDFDMPQRIFQTINLSGNITANSLEIRPANFDPKRRYPVLFYVYGGPQSQMVKRRFEVDFQSVVAGSLNTIVVIVDGRGTGFRGRAYRSTVRDRLGLLEASDQITAAKIWSQRAYVDSARMSIWGWSYGGFTTLKTLETDGGDTFQYGMAVAPVTDWRFYDSVFAERYMHDPETNQRGYDQARISNMAKLANTTRFLIMHGTGDDNVHIQNTLSLLDELNLAEVENYDLMMFPDSDHSIYHHNANTIVYDKLFSWIKSAFETRNKLAK